MMPRTRSLLVLLVFVTLAHGDLFAQQKTDKDKSGNSPVIKHWLSIADEMAKKQTISSTADPVIDFELREKAVFRHTQPLRGDDIGAVYLWTLKNKRPAAIGVFFAWSQSDEKRWVMQEFHSLFPGPIQKTMPGGKMWSTKLPGIKWSRFPLISEPHKDPRKQKIQAKQIPRKLKVMAAKSESERWPLRTVPKPFYEYAVPTEGVEYGAVWGLCQGTDTELVVLVESRVKGDKREWFYALAPFTDYQVEVTLPDGEVWKSADGRVSENGKPHYWDYVQLLAKPDFEKTK